MLIKLNADGYKRAGHFHSELLTDIFLFYVTPVLCTPLEYIKWFKGVPLKNFRYVLQA